MPAYDQNGAKFVRLVSVANPCTNGQSGAELLHPINDDGTDFSFGGGSQTPWISDIDAATFNLTNVALIKGPTADAFLSIGNGAQVVLYNNNNLGTGIDDTGVVSKHGNVYLDAAVAIDAVNSPIINLADPTNPQDAATKAYVDASGGGSQTPWTSDIDAAGYKLLDNGGTNYLWLNTGGNVSVVSSSAITLMAGIDTDGIAIIDNTFGGGPLRLMNPGSSTYSAAWIDMPIDIGASGIGSGGPGANAWIAYVWADAQWFDDSIAGDIAYRNGSGRLIFGVAGGNANLCIDTGGRVLVSSTTDDGTSAAFQVNGDASVSGAYWSGGTQGGSGFSVLDADGVTTHAVIGGIVMP